MCVFLCLIDRSPSPEPIYSSDGKRLNTREFRTRKKLEEERHSLVLRMQSINPDFKPPVDYKYEHYLYGYCEDKLIYFCV